ncbi:hypothetical protein RUM44_005335 [Polyplax serrata]|uniref:Uncharacterized protein n=1 Tax=Polyplax serrata TaxID=468196 RepID=A0ABR1AEV6_POLSC
MEATEKLRKALKKNLSATEHARCLLNSLIFIGFAISGMVEHGITVALHDLTPTKPAGAPEDNTRTSRRYCDPPNMTALAIYYDSSEETHINDEYDFSQLQEMFFQVNLTSHEKMEFQLRKSYLWGTLVSPILASRLAVNVGPKKVFGYSLLGAAASTLLVPAAWLTSIHVAVRFFQGFFCVRKYIGYALCELLTAKVVQTLGPGSIYYITSILILVWFTPWSTMVFNTPVKHLMKSSSKKNSARFESAKPADFDFPFTHFLCSRPVWMSTGVIFGSYCSQVSINVGMRLYLKYIFDMRDNYFSAIPFLLHSVFAVFCGHVVNFIQKTKFVSVTSSRRMFVYISHFLPAALLFVIGFVSCESTAPLFIYSLAVILNGATYSGALSSTIDLAPNYAGPTVAVCCTLATAGSIITTHQINSVLNGEMMGSWRLTFSLTSLILLVSSIFFMLRGSGTVQSWNVVDSGDPEKSSTFRKNEDKQNGRSVVPPEPRKPRTTSMYAMEKKILKVLHVQEPDKFTRVRAYSTNALPNERVREDRVNVFKPSRRKRASIT